MPNNVKTYDGTGDPEDHIKIFQAAAQVERWAMPTWCHMFNSTLIGTARVWFDELPPKSIDGYKDLKAAFLAYFMQHVCRRRFLNGSALRTLLQPASAENQEPNGPGDNIVNRSLSPYNGIIGRLGIREIQAVPSTTHGMLKFLVDGGIVTIRSTILIPAECATVTTSSKEIPKESEVRNENFKVALHPNFPDQEVAIGGTLLAEGVTELCLLLKKNLDIFVWQPSDMTGVPRSVAEHRFNIREGYPPVRQKKRGQAPERAKAIQAEVQKLVEAGIMREVYYHDWLSNPVMVKKHDGSWRIFLSKSAEKSLPLFKTLKKCIKKSNFHWTPEAEQAFKQLKQHLSELPLLVAPKPKEQLIVYLSASHRAISAVLMTERGTVQTPVYFVCRALQGPKLNYTPMEKLVLLLVFVAKRLRRYFQAHPIAVITDQPIKQIMSRPDVAGRLQKWSVMLGEHSITYRPRTSVKGQILADFLVEKPDESPPDTSVVEIPQEP
ncbi:reverse transcriptase domain-containing protein [Tanacetum coccineum]